MGSTWLRAPRGSRYNPDHEGASFELENLERDLSERRETQRRMEELQRSDLLISRSCLSHCIKRQRFTSKQLERGFQKQRDLRVRRAAKLVRAAPPRTAPSCRPTPPQRWPSRPGAWRLTPWRARLQ